jgi:hypothetical protein
MEVLFLISIIAAFLVVLVIIPFGVWYCYLDFKEQRDKVDAVADIPNYGHWVDGKLGLDYDLPANP